MLTTQSTLILELPYHILISVYLNSVGALFYIDTIHTDSSKPRKPITHSLKIHMASKARTRQSRVGPNWDHHRPSRCRHTHFFKIILPSTMQDMKLVNGNVLHYYMKSLASFFILFFSFPCCSLLLYMSLVLLYALAAPL